MSDKPWNPEVERIRKSMMERFSDKLSMEEIAEFAYSFAAECRAPAPQPAKGKNLAQELRRRCNTKLSLLHQSAWYEACNELEKLLAATPRVTPWKSHFTDSDVTGDIHNYVDTGDGKRLWAQDADEIVRRHNEGTSEQAPPTPELCLGCGQECDIHKGTLVSVNGWYHESCAPKLFGSAASPTPDKD
jgi:hypothetical protein